MPTRSRQERDASGRPPTATERARRAEITQTTIELIGEGGWSVCTLQAVAERMGVTKAAVLYHVGTKSELVRQAYAFVIEDFAGFVHERMLRAEDAADAVIRFADAHLEYMQANRSHARVIVEALHHDDATGLDDAPEDARRAEPLIALIEEARGDSRGESVSAAVLATAIAGIIDANVSAWLADPEFDIAAGQRLLRGLIPGML